MKERMTDEHIESLASKIELISGKIRPTKKWHGPIGPIGTPGAPGVSGETPITRKDFESVTELVDILLKKIGVDISYDSYRKMNPSEKKGLLRELKINSISE